MYNYFNLRELCHLLTISPLINGRYVFASTSQVTQNHTVFHSKLNDTDLTKYVVCLPSLRDINIVIRQVKLFVIKW